MIIVVFGIKFLLLYKKVG